MVSRRDLHSRQLCCAAPRNRTISVVTGDRQAHEHRLADYAAYYRSAKRRFEERVFQALPATAAPTYPEPVDHCRVCSWWAVCWYTWV